MKVRPPFIMNAYRGELTRNSYPGDPERLSDSVPVGRLLGLTRLGVHFEVLQPGRRTSWPHAEETEEEFILVIRGRPSVWIDGESFELEPGDAVAFPAGTGICHTFLNNSREDAHLLVVGERRDDNRIYYPFNERGYDGMDPMLVWTDPPKRPFGNASAIPHGGDVDEQA